MNYSVNQARQLYVAKTLGTAKLTDAATAGTIRPNADTVKNHLYFEYKGADNLMRSDLIDIKNILYAKATDADSMAQELKAVTVTLDSEVNGGDPVAGQDYVLRIIIRNFVGIGDDNVYQKYGMVHAYAGMDKSDFYKKLAVSLAKNFSRETTQLLKFTLVAGSTKTEVTASTDPDTLTGTYTSIIIDEVEQPWVLGKLEQVPVNFEVQFVPVTVDSDERIWGTAEETDPAGTIGNGKKIADLEYFCMGERGDVYRGMGYPNNINTTYLVDPTQKYNVIDIHYAYVGSNESVQKSEKTLTIVVPKVGANNSVSNALANNIIDAINTKTGLTIAKLDTSTGA